MCSGRKPSIIQVSVRGTVGVWMACYALQTLLEMMTWEGNMILKLVWLMSALPILESWKVIC